MDDLVLPAEIKDRIRRSLVVLKKHRILFEDWGMSEIPGFKDRVAASLNFVGVSGTGKSFAAEVVANELGRSLMIVNYAQLESKYVGETSKHIEIIFAEARKHGNVVVLFDEADSFLGRRMKTFSSRTTRPSTTLAV